MCIDLCTYTQIYIYIYACTRVYTYIHVYTCISVYICVSIINMCIYVGRGRLYLLLFVLYSLVFFLVVSHWVFLAFSMFFGCCWRAYILLLLNVQCCPPPFEDIIFSGNQVVRERRPSVVVVVVALSSETQSSNSNQYPWMLVYAWAAARLMSSASCIKAMFSWSLSNASSLLHR